jgi:hypothetical protein
MDLNVISCCLYCFEAVFSLDVILPLQIKWQAMQLRIITLEHYFLIKAFWQKAGTSDPNNGKFW